MMLDPLYAIADVDVLRARGLEVRSFGEGMLEAGVKILQYRNKHGEAQEILQDAAVLLEVFAGSECRLVMNDRADLAILAGFGGVHVGQRDLSPEDARRVVGAERLVGVSTHTDDEVRLADLSCADYVAVGPVFPTGTKLDAKPVVGLEGVRRARMLTRKPIVAIGGITRDSARSVIDSGANSVAVISGLLTEGGRFAKVAEDFLRDLR